jgi:tetratricopeptide (TPR) repeat protein
MRGDVKKVAELAQALLDYGKRHSNIFSVSNYYLYMAESRSIAGDIFSAIEYYKKSIQHSHDLMLSYVAKMLLGLCYLSTGQVKDVQDTIEGVIEHSKKFGFEYVGGAALGLKGIALIAQGNLKEGVALYENVMRTLFESKSLYRYAAGNYLMGMVYSKIAQGGGEKKDFSFLVKNIGFLIKTMPFAFKKAEEHFNEAIKVAKEIGAKSILGQAYLDLGRLYKAKGKIEKARESLSNAIETFEKCEADVYLKQAREALAALG